MVFDARDKEASASLQKVANESVRSFRMRIGCNSRMPVQHMHADYAGTAIEYLSIQIYCWSMPVAEGRA